MILKIVKQTVSDLYKINLLRFLIVFFRFIFFFYILRRKKLLYDEKEDINNLVTFLEKRAENKKQKTNTNETTIEHNLNYSYKIFNLREKYQQFIGGKTKALISPLESLDFIDKKNFKILSIGPRNEGELFLIRSFGYDWKNINAIDLHTYSKKINLGDMHEIKFDNNSFDLIISGWTLAYSTNKKKALDEIIRVSKKNAIISIGFTFVPEIETFKMKNNDYKLFSTKQLIEYYNIKKENILFNFDSYEINKNEKRHSIVIFRIEK